MANKIFWYSVPSLHDSSNGAAIHNKVLLEALAARGIEVKALNAFVADDPRGLENLKRIATLIEQREKEQHPELANKPQRPKDFLQFTDNKVEYYVVKTTGRLAQDVTATDQGKIFDFFIQLLEKFQPDVIMGYSGDLFSCYLRHEAQARGIPVVYALCNGLHRGFAFADCDLVFSPSEATAKLYRDEDGIDVKAVGQFIYRQQVTCDPAKRDPKYITLINPAPEKGLAIFVKLAQLFNQRHPEQKFLVVKSVGDYTKLLARLHYADGTPFVKVDDPNPIPMIDIAEHTNDIRLVYAVTKVLLTPSVWHESWGCVATEAVFNNIPVLSSKSGGLPEAVREGGILLDAPASTQKDYYCVPSDEELEPWLDALERLLNEDWTEQCQKASAYNDLDHSVDRLLEYLQPIMDRGQQTKKPLEQSYFFSAPSMQRRKEAYAQLAQQQQQALQQKQQAEQQQQQAAPQQAKAQAPAAKGAKSKGKKKK